MESFRIVSNDCAAQRTKEAYLQTNQGLSMKGSLNSEGKDRTLYLPRIRHKVQMRGRWFGRRIALLH